ncbi:hypothetical protein PK28_18100 (plasmid) [Hymenobacter sp. DG25B]|uniref:hypothetical protein n=1 Tax=Hymenobacter sp. DG25B TaxID=1385664 RepID=UPI0005407ADA|nr:hypothetical protein [Hymenobacter sp. DG25B]AIZ65542.1 hypothetical protein PK28_18100 [Hymenobacter sp. DG25B]
MQKQLRKPANWQDFERLCKQLWGEVWRVPYEIKLNGRAGQAQAGVDVYAIPEGENAYWGIQCKLKDESTNAQLTEAEIAAELAKARMFEPPLAVLVLATTANKDVALERIVRGVDLASRREGGPKVLLYCWDDIVGLLDQHRQSLDWYLNAQKFSDRFDFALRFADSSQDLLVRPEFTRSIKIYEYPAWTGHPAERPATTILVQGEKVRIAPIPKQLRRILDGFQHFQHLTQLRNNPFNVSNLAVCPIELHLTNTGTRVLENWKVQFEFGGEIKALTDSRGDGLPSLSKPRPNKFEQNRFTHKTMLPLVQGDSSVVEVFLLPMPEAAIIPVRWKLLARDYSKEGVLQVTVRPRYNNRFEYEAVENPEALREPEILSIKESMDE